MLEELKHDVWQANLLLQSEGLVKMTWGNVSGVDVEGVVVDIHPTSIEVEGTDTTLFIPNSKAIFDNIFE